jgi:hypothetical protein
MQISEARRMTAFKLIRQSPVLDLPLTLKYSFILTLSDFEKNVSALLNLIDGAMWNC